MSGWKPNPLKCRIASLMRQIDLQANLDCTLLATGRSQKHGDQKGNQADPGGDEGVPSPGVVEVFGDLVRERFRQFQTELFHRFILANQLCWGQCFVLGVQLLDVPVGCHRHVCRKPTNSTVSTDYQTPGGSEREQRKADTAGTRILPR